MPFKNRIDSLKELFSEFPKQYWMLIGAFFIDRIGGALIFPFLTLYITKRFNIGMANVGLIFGVYSISSIAGTTFGGALTDRMGRKGTLIFGLMASAFSSLLMGLVGTIDWFIATAVIAGLFASVGEPAGQAMVVDLLPEEKRADGFGILRVIANLAVVVGPAIGGILAAKSFVFLFISDAVASTITSILILVFIKETRTPTDHENKDSHESLLTTFRGYGDIIKDLPFMIFLGLNIVIVLVYMQMNTTLGVFLRDIHGITEQRYGFIISLNAAMVVLFQFAITRRIRKIPRMLIMSIGTIIYAIGFSMYGFTSSYGLFLLAMAIITLGEMLVVPVSSAIVSDLSPEDKRGRYMAAFSFSWILPNIFGIYFAGLIMDNLDPRLVWYIAGILGLLVSAGFYSLYQKEKRLVASNEQYTQ